MRTSLLWLVFFLFMMTNATHGQSLETTADSKQELQKPHAFGFGLEACIGDATLLQIVPALHFSYRYSMSPKWSAQISFSYTTEALLQRMTTAGQFASMSSEMSNSHTSGLMLYYSTDDRWSFGIGAFVRYRSYAYFIARYPFLDDTWSQYLMDYRVGCQVSGEYKLASIEQIDILLKAQCTYYLPAFTGDAVIGNEIFYDFPATPIIRTVGYVGTVANYFSLAIPTPPINAGLGLSVRVRF